jgi:hypothetical protein
LKRIRCLEDDIKIDVKEIRSEDVDLIQLAHDMVQCIAFVSTVINLRLP